jgi:hypothetical protein
MWSKIIVVALVAWCTVATNAIQAENARLPNEDSEAPSPYWLDDVRNCGPRCLHFLEQWFGGTKTFKEVSAVCPPGREGVSLKDLNTAAARLGWRAKPFETSAGRLTRLTQPTILHVEPLRGTRTDRTWGLNHFCVLLGHDPSSGEYLLYDPPHEVRRVPRSFLAKRFTGLGLLVDSEKEPALDSALESRRPWPPVLFLMTLAGMWSLSRRKLPTRRVPETVAAYAVLAIIVSGCGRQSTETAASRHYFAGDVVEGAKITHVFQLENGSAGPFLAANVSASCTCTHSFLEDTGTPLRPKARVPLKVEFDTLNERGQQRKSVIVQTDSTDPEWKQIEFAVEAHIVRPVQNIPDVVQFASVPRGKSAVRQVSLEANDTHWQGITPAILPGRYVTVTLQPGATSRMSRYAIELHPPDTNGPLYDSVTFRYASGGQIHDVVVPWQADVTGVLKVLPRQILVTAFDKSLGKRQRLRLLSPEKKSFRVTELKLPPGVTMLGEQPTEAREAHDFVLNIDAKEFVEAEARIVILTDLPEDGQLEVPLILTKDAAKKKS